MALSVGSSLGPYGVTALIGERGHGSDGGPQEQGEVRREGRSRHRRKTRRRFSAGRTDNASDLAGNTTMPKLFRVLSVSLVVVAVLVPCAGQAQPIGGAILFEQHCASCHGSPGPDSRAPDRETLRQFTPERVLEALTSGAMAATVQGLTNQDKRDVAEWATARTLGTGAGHTSAMPNPCPSQPFIDPFTGPSWNGWSPDVGNSRFQPADAAGLTPDQVPRLMLKWAFGYPGGTSAASGAPTVVGGRVFVGSDTGFVYSLDAASGCVYWSFEAMAGVRASVSIGPIAGSSPARFAAYFGDVKAHVCALDAETGERMWTRQADSHPIARITGAPRLHGRRLYVPVSSLEEAAGAYPWYECCTFRGSVVAYDANTGEELWKSYSIAEPPSPTTRNAEGVQQWGPAGGAVWNSPVIDATRGALYIGSGNAYTAPAANDTDAVIAFDLETGRRRWWHQVTANDTFLINCYSLRDSDERFTFPDPLPAGQGWRWEREDAQYSDNCAKPEQLGAAIDVDVQAVMLHGLPDGRTVIVAGQQTGRVFALDPDREGATLWELTPGPEDRGNVTAGVTFGGATDGRLAFFPIHFQGPRGGPSNSAAPPSPAGSAMVAIRVGTGELSWYTQTPPPHCPDPVPPGCSNGINGAATAIPGVVFAGSLDGMLRAYSATDGHILWEYDTVQEFETVNRVPAKGGTLNGPGPTVVDGMVFMGSGYTIGQGIPGNALLAFAVEH